MAQQLAKERYSRSRGGDFKFEKDNGCESARNRISVKACLRKRRGLSCQGSTEVVVHKLELSYARRRQSNAKNEVVER